MKNVREKNIICVKKCEHVLLHKIYGYGHLLFSLFSCGLGIPSRVFHSVLHDVFHAVLHAAPTHASIKACFCTNRRRLSASLISPSITATPFSAVVPRRLQMRKSVNGTCSLRVPSTSCALLAIRQCGYGACRVIACPLAGAAHTDVRARLDACNRQHCDSEWLSTRCCFFFRLKSI